MVGIEARGVKFLQKKDVVLYTHIPVENYHYKEIEKKYVTMVVSASSIMFPAYATNFYLQPSINLEATSKSIAPASSISKEFTVSLGYVFNRKNSWIQNWSATLWSSENKVAGDKNDVDGCKRIWSRKWFGARAWGGVNATRWLALALDTLD